MNAMVLMTQGKVLNYPLAPCGKCKTVHRFCEMFDADQVVSAGKRICKGCWDDYREKSRNRTAARYTKDKQMEFVA